ncbi:hypothetical protein HBI45_011260 [Parastagonospora nodorum]|nr:hypothetical protein HBI45_011260 [Parastagonospora nodorum]
MASFTHLPAELMEYVYSYLDQPALYAVCQLNRRLHALVVPFLYRHVDLFIRSGDKLPRIDRFCLNVTKHRRLARRVISIRLGPSPEEDVREGQRWITRDNHFDDEAMYGLAMKTLEGESLVSSDYLRDALLMREYAAYAALILIVLPKLHSLHLADFKTASIHHVHAALRSLKPTGERNTRHASDNLMQRLSGIKTVTFNVDKLSGLAYRKSTARFDVEPVLNLPNVQELEFSIPDVNRHNTLGVPFQHITPWRSQHGLHNPENLANITRLVIRHSDADLQNLQPMLNGSTRLQSFTYDIFYDCNERANAPQVSRTLPAWSDSLPRSLKILVLGVEYCDTSAFPFQQPRTGEKLYGYLDLTNHVDLHTIEVPLVFLTGDPDFSITTEIYPLLPPNLKHLSLRTDMSNAQHHFPFDTSRLPKSLTFQESEDEARYQINARMDVSYMFHAAMSLLEFAAELEAVSIWQPADPSLCWFDGQIADFAQTCQNKSIKSIMVYPMMLRWKKQEHWNLVKEVTVFDKSRSSSKHHEDLYRGDRGGIPLGLASQYHLHALRNRRLRLR